METLASDVWATLAARHAGAQLIAHGGSNRGLPGFFVRAWVRTITLVAARRVDVVVTYDALTYLVLWPVLAVLGVPRIVLVNGLDLTWRRAPYPWLLRHALPRASRVIAISDATAAVARTVGVADGRLAVVHPSVGLPPADAPDRAAARRSLEQRLGLDEHAILLTTLGRLVPRKGGEWFVRAVMPRLPAGVHYVIAGSGPEAEPIARAAREVEVEDRVHLLGSVNDSEREVLLAGSDLFVQPNLATPGDMEGFGIVLVEATTRGTPAMASALEGMRDAVADGAAGWLCPPGDAVAWSRAIADVISDREQLDRSGQRFRAVVRERFGRDAFGAQLTAELMRAAAR